MSVQALNNEEIRLLREEVELLMAERQRLLHVAGAAAVLVANLDEETLPQDQDTIDGASHSRLPGVRPGGGVRVSANESVAAEFDPEAQEREIRPAA